MQKCDECGFSNLEGTMVCDECGFPIIKIVVAAPAVETPTAEPDVHSGMVVLHETSDVLLEFVGHTRQVTVPSNKRTVFGRIDAGAGAPPDIDLTPFGAFEKGVSRNHAALIRFESTLTLLDLDSSNGTLINGRRISANQPRVVQDGDEITFGQLVARVYFK